MRFRRTGKLAATGIRGRAEVLQITHTGMQANNLAKIRVSVRIAAEGLAPFEYEDDLTVPVIALRSLHPGNLLPVYVDPADPERFEIQWLARPERAEAPETEGPALGSGPGRGGRVGRRACFCQRACQRACPS